MNSFQAPPHLAVAETCAFAELFLNLPLHQDTHRAPQHGVSHRKFENLEIFTQIKRISSQKMRKGDVVF